MAKMDPEYHDEHDFCDSFHDLFNKVHCSSKIQWFGVHHENPSSLVGKRADLCVEHDTAAQYYCPSAVPNVRGYITAWNPMTPCDGSAKWCWHGESGDKFVLSCEDAYRAVRTAEANCVSRSSELTLSDVLRARLSTPTEIRKRCKIRRQNLCQSSVGAQAAEPVTGAVISEYPLWNNTPLN